MTTVRDQMAGQIAARLETIYLVSCDRCGGKQLVDLPAHDRHRLALDLIDGGWLIVNGVLWCGGCTERAYGGSNE